MNVCVGAYRTDEGKPYVLKCVRAAQEIIAADKSLNLEYLPQRGDQEFAALSREVLMGEPLMSSPGVIQPNSRR